MDVVFAQRLPGAIEQLVLGGSSEELDLKLIERAGRLLGCIINPGHRQMVINNINKGGGIRRLLKYVLRLQTPKASDLDETVPEFIKALVPNRAVPPKAHDLQTAAIQLIDETMRKTVLRALMPTDRINRNDSGLTGESYGFRAGRGRLEGAGERLHAVARPWNSSRRGAPSRRCSLKSNRYGGDR